MHWCNWASLSLPKTCRGIGFRDLSKFNIALLAKQGWRLVTNRDSLLGRIYKSKYYPHTSFWNATLGNNLSYAWKSIYPARKVLEDGIGWRAGSRSQILVLQAHWLPRWARGKFKQLLQTFTLLKIKWCGALITSACIQYVVDSAGLLNRILTTLQILTIQEFTRRFGN
ncbi:reverse transcriptase [Gossypium australe]|uniref:Reverse transcriptase n=1 Tax=Gossypium australe TaxID=47621 RepID=A0A5B6VHM6_9ROSI|nr:reverse transcriptase [Gossypium australe]